MAKDQRKALSVIGSLVAVAVLAVVGWFIFSDDSTQDSNTFTPEAEQSEVLGEEEQKLSVSLEIDFGDKKDSYEVSMDEGSTALSVLKKIADENGFELDIQEYEGMGEFVSGIDGKTGDAKNFWGFLVNGEMAEVGAGAYEVKDGDSIEFAWTPMQ